MAKQRSYHEAVSMGFETKELADAIGYKLES